MKNERGEEVEDLRLSESDAIPEKSIGQRISLPPANNGGIQGGLLQSRLWVGLRDVSCLDLPERTTPRRNSTSRNIPKRISCRIVKCGPFPYLRSSSREKFPARLKGLLHFLFTTESLLHAYRSAGHAGPLLAMGDTEVGHQKSFLSTMLRLLPASSQSAGFRSGQRNSCSITLFNEIGHGLSSQSAGWKRRTSLAF